MYKLNIVLAVDSKEDHNRHTPLQLVSLAYVSLFGIGDTFALWKNVILLTLSVTIVIQSESYVILRRQIRLAKEPK
jgi:hypothetical protein